MTRVEIEAPGDPVRDALMLLDGAVAAGRRAILGIAGSPASGKTSLVEWLIRELTLLRPGLVGHVGMDAFHLAGSVLLTRGTALVKGAAETFDAPGYAALLMRLRSERDHAVFAPVFHREIEDSIAHEAEIGPEVALVVTEGNYLLSEREPWPAVRVLLDRTWFLELDETVRIERLIARHMRYGRSRAEAMERAKGSDLVNANLVRGDAQRADAVVEWSDGDGSWRLRPRLHPDA